jgi:hypothetical protein
MVEDLVMFCVIVAVVFGVLIKISKAANQYGNLLWNWTPTPKEVFEKSLPPLKYYTSFAKPELDQ